MHLAYTLVVADEKLFGHFNTVVFTAVRMDEEMQTEMQRNSDERKIAAIVRRLPPERSAQVLAFARFLAYETFKPNELEFLEDEELFVEADPESDAQWETIFASEEGQTTLDTLADDAFAEIRAGKAKLMIFTADGEIAPG